MSDSTILNAIRHVEVASGLTIGIGALNIVIGVLGMEMYNMIDTFKTKGDKNVDDAEYALMADSIFKWTTGVGTALTVMLCGAFAYNVGAHACKTRALAVVKGVNSPEQRGYNALQTLFQTTTGEKAGMGVSVISCVVALVVLLVQVGYGCTMHDKMASWKLLETAQKEDKHSETAKQRADAYYYVMISAAVISGLISLFFALTSSKVQKFAAQYRRPTTTFTTNQFAGGGSEASSWRSAGSNMGPNWTSGMRGGDISIMNSSSSLGGGGSSVSLPPSTMSTFFKF